MRLRDLTAARVRYGFRRLHVLLRREDWPVNHKRIYRLYSEEGLSIRAKVPRRKRAWRYRVGQPGATAPNEVWSMDFVSDQLFDGRSIRILAVLDAHTQEALSIVPRVNFRAFKVVAELDQLARERGKPKALKVDNGPEFAGRMLDQWAHLNGVEIDFSRPGKPTDNAHIPTDNAHIEAFNSRLRAECLNASWFLSLVDVRDRLEAWRQEYNQERPHGSLRNLTPRAFAEQAQQARRVA
jgi:putative transposase